MWYRGVDTIRPDRFGSRVLREAVQLLYAERRKDTVS